MAGGQNRWKLSAEMMRTYRTKLPSGWLVALALFIGIASHLAELRAQSTVSGRPCNGQNGYVIRDARTGQVVSRGWTTSRGTLGDGVVLGANKQYLMTVAKGNGTIGSTTFTTGDNGSTLSVPTISVGDSIDRDSDGDGVPDDIEDVFGTDPRNPSTFGNGIRDIQVINTPPPPGSPGGPISITTNPAFGPPGIISNVQLPGNCVDICAFNDTIALACLDRGVTIFNVFNGLAPRQTAVVDTPGEARAVACPADDLPVADGPAGLAIIDLRDPVAAHIRAQVRLGSYAEAVASAGGTAYIGLRNGQLVTVDLSSATEVQRLNLGAEVFDVIISGDFVWAIAGNNLRSFSSTDGILTPVGTLALSSIGADPLSLRKRLFVGGGWAQAACMSGFDNIDVRNAAGMLLVGKAPPTGGPGSFKQLISNGSGLGVGSAGVNPRSDGTHDIYLYNISVPAKVTDLITILPTPGIAYASTIYNGFDYVADGPNGLQVMRYLETDRKGVAPTITLDSNASTIRTAQGVVSAEAITLQAEEGKLFRITANASDDVQVRNVEFYLDGQLVATDGNFPFEVFIKTPLRTVAKTTFTIRARAFDTGGNSTWSTPTTIALVSDFTPPRVARSQPAANTISGSLNSVIAFFSEPLRPDSVTTDSFRLVNAGADGVLGTTDDQAAPSGTLTYQDSLKAAVRTFASPLPRGLWQATISPPIADRAGNGIPNPISWEFYLFDQPDRDHDGLPDTLETVLGFDPDNPDSKGDGVRDGDRDSDNDGLSNAWEVLWGLDPRNAHTRNANVLDGDLDLDNDALSNRREQAAGTNPLVVDSDGDGWSDEQEFTGGSDALDPNSKPKLFFTASPPVSIVIPGAQISGAGGFNGLPVGITVSQPPSSIVLPGPAQAGGVTVGLTLALPPVSIVVPGPAAGNGVQIGLTIAQPPASVILPGITQNPGLQLGTTVAKPPVSVKIGN